MGVATVDESSNGIKFENFMQAGCRDQGLHLVLPKAYYSAKTGTLFWNILRIASTPFYYLCVEVLTPKHLSHKLFFIRNIKMAPCHYDALSKTVRISRQE